ncbi:hypothetical protein ASD19_08415 [Microbacterium sp. Root53]|uniref:TPM domain-containing protein n=1 Tax=Microbacterium sp. Root53 TaxID=1736553 RepID=UPI0006FC224E|nr:TPM domain-containing protein [Microbacterium sp. Root53]KQY96952.1 hypothetical protein ASD19_08415 [Microbacterium sp. Root53]
MSPAPRTAHAVATAVLAGALALAPLAAHAEPPGDLDPGYVTDRAGVLSASEERRLEQRLEALAAAPDRPELYVVFVDDFTSPSNALQWADRASLQNNLAADQYLLAIATEGRALAISAEYEGGPLRESRVLEIEDRLGSEHLANDDWVGGVEFVADEFDEVPPPWWVWLIGIGAAALLVFVIVQFVLLGRRRAARALELRTLAGQRRRASIALVRADEALRTSEQELDFVTAEFGEDATREYAQALADGRARIDRAFELQRRLEDATEDSPADTRSWTDEILAACAAVDRELERRRDSLARLRALAKDAQATLGRLERSRAEADRLVASAAERIATMSAAYAPAQVAPVADNASEMRRRLEAADEWLGRLRDAVSHGRAAQISAAVHEIERLIAETTALHTAVEAHAATLGVTAASSAPAVGSAVVGGDLGHGSSALPSSPVTTGEPTGDRELDRAASAVRTAEATVTARAGRVSAAALGALRQAHAALALARAALATDAAAATGHARDAVRHAETALTAAGIRSDERPGRRRVRAFGSNGGESSPTRSADEDDGAGGRALWGAVSGGAVGLFSSLGVADESDGAAGIVLLFTLGGVVLGALSGWFGNGEGGGSSSGWGGSSSSGSRSRSSGRSSFGGRSSGGRSSGRSSSRSSRSFGGSRSSGRSGGRRF